MFNSIDDLFNYIKNNYSEIVKSHERIKNIWLCAGQLGVFSNKDENFSVFLLEKLCEYDLYDFPFWLQRNVIIRLFEKCASMEQKEKYLNKLYKGKIIASLALTEDFGGSDFGNIHSTYSIHNNDYLLEGNKLYISCAEYADIILFAAKNESDHINLFILDRSLNTVLVEPIKCIEELRGLGISKITVPKQVVDSDKLLKTTNSISLHLTSVLSYERFCCAYTVFLISKKILKFDIKWANKRKAMNYQDICFHLTGFYSEYKLLDNYFCNKKHAFDQYNNIIVDAAILKYRSVKLALNISQYSARLIAGNFICYDKELNLSALNNIIVSLSAAGGTQEVMKRIISEKMKSL